MSTSQYLPFAIGGSANVLPFSTYSAEPWVTTGFPSSGSDKTAYSIQLNTVWRQSSMVAAAVAQFIVNELSININDDGNLTNLVTHLTEAIQTAAPGTVTGFSAGNLVPLFTTSVAFPTSTPALTFTQTIQNANQFFAGPSSGGAVAPTFRSIGTVDLPAGSFLSASAVIAIGTSGAPTLVKGLNVASVTQYSGSGVYIITFSSAFPNANYTVECSLASPQDPTALAIGGVDVNYLSPTCTNSALQKTAAQVAIFTSDTTNKNTLTLTAGYEISITISY